MKYFIALGSLMMILLLHIPSTSAQDTPAIIHFSTSATTVTRQSLEDQSARIPVSWQTVNRPQSANLVFEQILPDSSTINVELPRDNPFVASNGEGIAAPILPDEDATEIRLQVRLIDTTTQQVYDTADITLPIIDTDNTITLDFSTTFVGALDPARIANGTFRIPVRWQVTNRPANTNLVFEQVLPDGTTRNAELPRDVLIVPSKGDGIVIPVVPDTGMNYLMYQVRLVNLTDNSTLAQSQIQIPISTINANPAPQPVTNATINSFTISPESVTAGSQVTLSWDLSGDFTSAVISWTPDLKIPIKTPLVQIEDKSGSYTFDIPTYLAEQRQITLEMEDSSGTLHSESVTLTINCAYAWGMNIQDAFCPYNALFTAQATYQTIDNGFMIRIPDTNYDTLDEVWVFYTDGKAKQYNPDEAPTGIAGSEQTYTVQYQRSNGQNRYDELHHYMTLPDGAVIKVTAIAYAPYMTWVQN